MSVDENPSILELVGVEALDEAEDDADHILNCFQNIEFNLSENRIRDSANNTLSSLRTIPSRNKGL